MLTGEIVTGLVRGSLDGPGSNLGRRYIKARLAVCLSSSGDKLELVRQMWEKCGSGVCSWKFFFFFYLFKRVTKTSSGELTICLGVIQI
jgi:hypothetical protein